MTVGPGWDLALARAASRRVTMLVGDVDSGKTSLATFLANGLRTRGLCVGIVDADLGQSEIGPPTTVGLGLVQRTLARPSDADVAGLSFVGSTSPEGHVASTVAATREMVERAMALELDRIIVDTSGLVAGPLGRALKQRKIQAVDPDLLICLERGEECSFADSLPERRDLLRLRVSEHARPRSAAERRRYRESALATYFTGAERRELAVAGLTFRATADRAEALGCFDAGLEGALVGLDDAAGKTLGIGVVRAADDRVLTIDTPVYDVGVAGVRLGRQSSAHRIGEVTR